MNTTSATEALDEKIAAYAAAFREWNNPAWDAVLSDGLDDD